MRLEFKHLSMIAASVVLIGCGGGGGSSAPTSGSSVSSGTNTAGSSGSTNTVNTGGGTTTSSSKDITISEDNQVESLGKEKNIHATVNIGNTSKSLYILLSNYSKTQSASSTIIHNAKVVPVSGNKKLLQTSTIAKQPKVLHAPAYIQKFNAKVKTLLQKDKKSDYRAKSIAVAPRSNKSVGDSETFYMDSEENNNTTTATLKKIVSNVSTRFGNKTLNIWVSDDSFEGDKCKKAKCVTQAMVDEFADNFLKEGADNDIYDWVTNIFGEEWGETKYNGFIGVNNEITILLTDIGNDDSPSGGVIGYFYAKDNLSKSQASGSNERIMFYADSVMFANDANNGFWQKEMYSTLAHEFQHMIHFYQKTLLLTDPNNEEDTWINEMLSETTEDLIATKIGHTGPRGVAPDDGSAGDPDNTKGRYPGFNQENTLSLTTWNNSMGDYSKVNAFGTFLTRNYGGAQILHDIMKNDKLHEDAIMEGVHKVAGNENKTFNDILKEWGIAVLLSDKTDATPSYNTGDFTVSKKGDIVYKMGSINFFNYYPQPQFSDCSAVKAQGNCYYKIGDKLTGTVKIDLTLNGTTEATLIAK